MAFPIIPKRRSGAAGNPSSLQLGELAVNTLNGELYLGADGGVMLLNGPVAAGTTVTEATGDGTTVAFTFAGYNGTADSGYLVSVGGIDQPPSKYSITNTAGGTITFVEAPVAGELISIRAIVAGGGGGDGNAIQIQGRDIASTAPTNGQFLAWNSTTSKWEPQGGGGSVTFNETGTHLWSVPAWVRYAAVSAIAGNGSDGTATNGQPGQAGISSVFDSESGTYTAPTTGANGANGTATAGAAGKSISISALSFVCAGGAAGLAGLPGYGGGGSGGGGLASIAAAAGAAGNGPLAGGGGGAAGGLDTGGLGGGTAEAGQSGSNGGAGGAGANGGGNGGSGGTGFLTGGGGGGGDQRSGGGGGGGAFEISGTSAPGVPGAGGVADTSMCAGGAGETFNGALNFAAYAGGQLAIVISEGEGNASITITW